jgi:hypothetical protein
MRCDRCPARAPGAPRTQSPSICERVLCLLLLMHTALPPFANSPKLAFALGTHATPLLLALVTDQLPLKSAALHGFAMALPSAPIGDATIGGLPHLSHDRSEKVRSPCHWISPLLLQPSAKYASGTLRPSCSQPARLIRWPAALAGHVPWSCRARASGPSRCANDKDGTVGRSGRTG